MKEIKEIISFLKANFTSTLDRMYLINAPKIFTISWGAISSNCNLFKLEFIHPVTVQKFNFVSTTNLSKLFETIDPAQLQKKYGGNLENLKEFFPPKNTFPNQGKRGSIRGTGNYLEEIPNQRIISNNNNHYNNDDAISESDMDYQECRSYRTILDQNIDLLEFDSKQNFGMPYIENQNENYKSNAKSFGCGCGDDKKCEIF
mgnify:CR=1 FL=1